jgi:ParB family chromosome partitioning protein
VIAGNKTSGAKKQQAQARIVTVEEDPENDIKSVDDKNADKVVGNIIELEIEAIEINPFQPRSNFNEESLRGCCIHKRIRRYSAYYC